MRLLRDLSEDTRQNLSIKCNISHWPQEMGPEFEQSGLKITIRKDHILVEPSRGIDFSEVLHGLSQLLSTPEILDKNEVWVFRAGEMKIGIPDLYEINAYVKNNFPKCTKEKKTAIVVETGLQRSLAEMYTKIEKEPLHEIRVFSDFKSAEEWVS